MIEHDEVEVLIREALAARGAPIPDRSEMRIMCNHKKNTVRLAFDAPLEPKKPAKKPAKKPRQRTTPKYPG